MADVVWWEIETPAPERFQEFSNSLYLEVADLEATLRRATALGALVERERTALGGADRWFAIMRDPSGVSFGLWTPNPGD
jgi:predicted enzyme related to lactoylglutathione lyase